MSSSRKVCNLERLIELRDEARATGRRVVHCHGCFDIVHPGHIHYLQFARNQGDLLIVSVSADPQVNKGVNRPLIPEDLRAASLAALECVDHVYVNPHPTAVELLEQLQPDIYVKGREYEHNNDPRFLAESEMVVKSGGRVVFSSGDVIYSSTALIGSMAAQGVFNQEKLRRFLQQYDLSGPNLLANIAAFRRQKVVVVGDYILDRYHFCEAASVASESPMMNLREIRAEDYDGGAGVIALHLAAMGASPVLVTALADDQDSQRVESRLRLRGTSVEAIHTRKEIPLKRRYLAEMNKILKVDQGASNTLDARTEDELGDRILAAAQGASAIIFADFGYGLISARLLERIMPILRRNVGIITADVSGMRSNLLHFKDVDLLCPTEREVRETLHEYSCSINALVSRLLSLTSARQAMITLGKQGLLVFDQYRQPAAGESWERSLRSEYLPALCTSAVDPMGCGDALLATASLTLAAGGCVHAASYLGSIAAALEAQRIGNQPITLDDLSAGLAHPAGATEPWRIAS